MFKLLEQVNNEPDPEDSSSLLALPLQKCGVGTRADRCVKKADCREGYMYITHTGAGHLHHRVSIASYLVRSREPDMHMCEIHTRETPAGPMETRHPK